MAATFDPSHFVTRSRRRVRPRLFRLGRPNWGVLAAVAFLALVYFSIVVAA